MTMIIEELAVKLGADVSEMISEFQRAQKEIAELKQAVAESGRAITEVGSKMTAASAIVIGGIAAMNGGFQGHVKELAKVAGALQGLTLVTGNMMQSYARTSDALAEFDEMQSRIVRSSNHASMELLSLAKAAGSAGSAIAGAATLGWGLGEALDKLFGISEQFNYEGMFEVDRKSVV